MDTDFQLLWEKVIEELYTIYDEDVFNEYIKPHNRVYKFSDNTFYIITHTLFHKSKLENYYYKTFTDAIEKICEKPYDLKFVTKESIEQEEHIIVTPVEEDFVPRVNRGNLKLNYNFDTYVAGINNRLAYTLSLQVAERPGIFNPLYIFGGVGLGKTHLMQAIGNYILDNNKNARVLYMKAEMFIEDFVSSLHNKSSEMFSDRFKDIDVLLLDDIQFLSNKEESQNEFFKIFDILHNQNKQIVVTSDRKSSELKNIMDRLRSRFEWGMQADITPPDLETRIEIVKKKIQSERIDSDFIPEDVIVYIAKVCNNNVRELEGALKRVLFYITLENENCTVEIAKKALKSIISESQSDITANEIIEKVCDYYKVPKKILLSKSRKKIVSHSRHLCMYLIRTILDLPYKQIANLFGGKDHTSVLYAIDKIKLNIQVNEELVQDINNLKKQLNVE